MDSLSVLPLRSSQTRCLVGGPSKMIPKVLLMKAIVDTCIIIAGPAHIRQRGANFNVASMNN